MKIGFEFKYAVRAIRNKAGHSLLCIAIIGLAIGISWIAFSLYYPTQAKPVPFVDANRWMGLVGESQSFNSRFGNSIDNYSYQILKQSNLGVEQFGGLVPYFANLNDEASTVRVTTAAVSGNVFAASQLNTEHGRLLNDSDTFNDTSIVLSYDLWANQFSQQADIVGQSIRIDGQFYTVVGVLAEGQYFLAPFDLYFPFRPTAVSAPNLNDRVIPVVKLSPGQSKDQLNQQLAQITANIETEFPTIFSSPRQYWLQPLHKAMAITNEAANIAFTLFGITALAIAILGCINVANLFVSRVLERQQELALRGAIGSSRYHLICQSLLETFFLCVGGVLLGIVLSYGLGYALEQVTSFMLLGLDSNIPLDTSPTPSKAETIFLITTLLSIWLISSILPISYVIRQDPATILASASKGSTDRQSGSVSKVIVSLQVICSCFLLVVSGSLVYAMDQFNNIDYGVKKDGLWTARADLPEENFNAQARLDYIAAIHEELIEQANISAAAVGTGTPGMMTTEVRYAIEDRDIRRRGNYPLGSLVAIDNHYLTTLNIDIVSGRNFDSTDRIDSLAVALVDERFAKRFWPNDSALGKRVQLDANGEWITIIGVTKRIAANWPDINAPPLIYRPLSQTQDVKLHIISQFASRDDNAVIRLRAVAKAVNPDVAFYRILSFEKHFYSLGAGASFFSILFSTVAIATAILAILGIYGVIARMVMQRFTEIGLRRALGSSKQKVLWIYLRRSLTYVAIGSLLGGGAALMAYQTLSAFLDSQAGAIPLIYLCVSLGLALLIAIATYIPVRDAIKLEPGEALHYS